MATICKTREQRFSLPSYVRTPVLKTCFDLDEKARYQELLQSLNINSFRRSSEASLSSFAEQTPTTSFQLDSTLGELRRLQHAVSYSTAPVSTPSRFSQCYSLRSTVDRTKSAYYYAKKSLEKLDQINSLPKFEPHSENSRVSSTPDVISLDGEDILANYEKEKKISANRKSLENDAKKPFPDILGVNKRFENDPSFYMKSRNDFYKDREIRAKRVQELYVEAELRQKARQTKQKCVETEIRVRMRLEGLVIEEPEEEEEAFIALIDEQLNLVDDALGPGNSQEVLVDAFSVQIRRVDIRTLAGLGWLNDEIINFYFNLIMDRGGKEKLPSVYVFNTFFYPKLAKEGHKSLARWTRRVDVFKHDMILIPIHLGVHWCLAVIDFGNKLISYYDSMGGRNQTCVESLLQYLKDESLDKKKEIFDSTNWKANYVSNIPQQMNGSDCGVFACKFAEYVSRKADFNFTQEHMPYFRKRMVYEILTKRLM